PVGRILRHGGDPPADEVSSPRALSTNTEERARPASDRHVRLQEGRRRSGWLCRSSPAACHNCPDLRAVYLPDVEHPVEEESGSAVGHRVAGGYRRATKQKSPTHGPRALS